MKRLRAFVERSPELGILLIVIVVIAGHALDSAFVQWAAR